MSPQPKSIFAEALAVLPQAKAANAEGSLVLQTDPFLQCCKQVLPVVECFGSALLIVKSDIGGNIKRLEAAKTKDPEKFKELYAIVRQEVDAGTATGAYSSTQALLWLTRAMDFLLGLLKSLESDPEATVHSAAQAAYDASLKPFHGWIAKNAFSVALYVCPSRKTFFEKLGEGYVKEDLQSLLQQFEPMLKENHEFLESVGCDKLSAA